MLFIPIFTSQDLYTKSGKAHQKVEKAIDEWEKRNINLYVDLYTKGYKGKTLSKEASCDILISRELFNDHYVNKDLMRDYVRNVILEDIKIKKLPKIYHENQILELLPD